MDKPTSFLKAMIESFKMPAESLADFRAQYGRLDDADKTWFKERFEVEYGWTW